MFMHACKVHEQRTCRCRGRKNPKLCPSKLPKQVISMLHVISMYTSSSPWSLLWTSIWIRSASFTFTLPLNYDHKHQFDYQIQIYSMLRSIAFSNKLLV